MEDFKIVDLYWERSERAISETRTKYERMLSGISYSLLRSEEDAEECVNDTYLSAWNSMPSDRPIYLGAYLSKIIRALSIDKFRSKHSKRRGGFEELCEELDECIPDTSSIQSQYENGQLAKTINRFIEELPEEKRVIFVRRYFYSDSVEQIAKRMGFTSSKVKTSLFRMREELRQILEKEDMLV
jgi:RNA polymerase sigma-70 factor (ECF subfamily)